MSAIGGRLQRKLFNNLKLERMVYTFMTENGSTSQWIQDNLRIIISTGIVILLVFAIYSYSQRNSRVNVVVDDSQIEEVATNGETTGDDEINKIIAEINDENIAETAPAQETSQEPTPEPAEDTAQVTEATNDAAAETERIARIQMDQEQQEALQRAKEEARVAAEKKQEELRVAKEQEQTEQQTPETEDQQPARDVVQEIINSQKQQTEGVIVVTAVYGDSATTLARKALAEYSSQKNITDLTGAHKIYIEDYLRKHHSVIRIYPGTEMQFTHAMIEEAIAQSRTLTEAELANLDKYAQRVSNL